MATQNGAKVNFSFTNGISVLSGTGIALANSQIQSADLTKTAKNLEIADASGETMTDIYYDQQEACTLEYFIKGTDVAAAVTASVLPAPGSVVTLTSTAMAVMSSAAGIGGLWIAQSGVKAAGTNTDALKVTVPLKRSPGITS